MKDNSVNYMQAKLANKFNKYPFLFRAYSLILVMVFFSKNLQSDIHRHLHGIKVFVLFGMHHMGLFCKGILLSKEKTKGNISKM